MHANEYRVALLGLAKKLNGIQAKCNNQECRSIIQIAIDGVTANLLPTAAPSRFTIIGLLSGVNYQLELVVRKSIMTPRFGRQVVSLQEQIEDTKRRIGIPQAA